MPQAAGTAKPKTVNYVFIEPVLNGNPHPLYEEMNRLIATNHPDLAVFKIGLWWKRGIKPDKDGKLVLGRAMKVPEHEGVQTGYHGKIFLNEEWWNDNTTAVYQKTAVLDHELCHFAADKDDNGDTKQDERGQPLIRMRCHDLEEFECIVNRHGLYTQNLERMAGAMYNARNPPAQGAGNRRPAQPANLEEALEAED